MNYIKNKILKLYILVLVTLFSSCSYDYIEPPKSQDKVLRLSKAKVNIANNSLGVVDIISGVGGYSVSKNNDRVDVRIIGKKVHIKARQTGDAKIIVTDNMTKEERNINVFVEDVNFEEVITVNVTGGSYTFGKRQITLSKGFKIGKYEVTVHQFCEFLNDDANGFKDSWGDYTSGLGRGIPNITRVTIDGVQTYIPIAGKANLPVTSMHWGYADKYCKWKGGRLPTDTEWEFAAIGGELGIANGNKLFTDAEKEATAWHKGNSTNELQDVQTKEPNILGIHNMIGNISEWAQDEWTDVIYYNYIRTSVIVDPSTSVSFDYNNLITNFPLDGNPFSLPPNSYIGHDFVGHVVRGGNVYSELASTIHKLRSARWDIPANFSDYFMGIRIVYDLP